MSLSHDHTAARLSVGLIASVSLHLMFVAGGAAWSASTGSQAHTSKPPAFKEPALPPEPDKDRVKLGEPDSAANTITWLGYDEYQEHVGDVPRPVDQPPLTLDPPSGVEAPPTLANVEPVSPPSPPSPPIPQTPMSKPAPEAPAAQEVVQMPDSQEPIEQKTPSDAAPVEEAPREREVEPVREPQSLPAGMAPIGVPAEEAGALPHDGFDEPVVIPEPKENPKEPAEPAEIERAIPESLATKVGPPDVFEQHAMQEPAPTTPTLVEQPAPPQHPTSEMKTSSPATVGKPGDSGRAADREADLAATKVAAKVQLGKPLASHGLRIRTVKPRTSHYNAVFARYVDPVIRVSFDRSGVVRNVVLLRKSENQDVDLYVLDAAYQWRAEGDDLKKLAPDRPGQAPDTLDVDFQIVRPLSGR